MRTIMKMKKIVVKEVKGYPGFRRYLNNQLVDLNYLTNEPAESRQWVFVLIFTTLLLNCVKMVIQFCQTSVNDLTYFIGDITIPVGSTKRQLALIYSSWLIGTSFCAFTLYRSQFNPYLQKWVSIGTIFDHLGSSKVHPHTQLPTVLHRYFIHLNRVAFYTGGIGALFLCLPSYFIYPQQFIVYLTVWLIITILAGFVVLGSAGNFGPLYAFYLFLFGSEMVLERSKLSKRIDRSHVDSKERLTKIVASSYSSSTITLKSMIAGYRFWVLFNQSIFLATYSAQYILIYLICFIDIHKFLRLALIAFGAINLCSGLSIHFFPWHICSAKD
ncbi:uncharacterized protein LOC107362955 [Tetranychus urticae]|uniref:uncharacterized protein LOC107362955 n=1 Tax=Tetranychus urticae TaxID=32264 RepID=UPI000D6488C2|nr:uncharacterized protein LOC107362955 [Tetranychus urticae]